MSSASPKKSKPKHQHGGKVFDVVPPGNTAVSPTSRPTIVGHKPHVQDDQFVVAAKASIPSDDSLLSHHEPDIEPVTLPHSDPEISPPQPASSDSAAEEPVIVLQPDEPKATIVTTPTEEDKISTEPSSQQLAVGQAAMVESASIDPLLASTADPTIGQAVVSTHKPKASLTKWLFTILLIIIFLVVIADAGLDAGIIKTTLNVPHTHFLSK